MEVGEIPGYVNVLCVSLVLLVQTAAASPFAPPMLRRWGKYNGHNLKELH